MRALTIIKSEHQNLAAVLYSMEHLIGEIDNGKHPDFAVFHGLFTYIDRFLDEYHHPKENRYLFPAVLARAPDTTDQIQELGRQHILEPTNEAWRRKVLWSHPAFAQQSVFARNDKEIIRVDLSEQK